MPEASAAQLARAVQVSGSACIMVRGPRWSRDGLPSTMYAARVNGAPAKPISGVLAELGHSEPDGFADRLQGFPGQLGQGGDVGRGADRLVQHGTDAGDDVHADSGQLERDDDVGEEDGGVDVVAADRLQGDLGGELGPQAGIQHGDALAHLEVFGQRTAGLAHEPDGTAGGLAAAVGGDQRGIRGAAVHQRVPGVKAGDFGGCRGARSHAFDCAENQPQKITTACHRPVRHGAPGPRRGAVAGITPRRVRSHAGQLFYAAYEKAMIVLLWFFFLWWRPTPTSTSRPLLN